MHLLINNEESVDVAAHVYEFTNVPNVEHVAHGFKNTLRTPPRPLPSPLFPYVHDEPFTQDRHKLVLRYSLPGSFFGLCNSVPLPRFHKAIFVLEGTRNCRTPYRCIPSSIPKKEEKKGKLEICITISSSRNDDKVNAISRVAVPSSERRDFSRDRY